MAQQWWLEGAAKEEEEDEVYIISRHPFRVVVEMILFHFFNSIP